MKEPPIIPHRKPHMDHSLKKRISERAYEIWAAGGAPPKTRHATEKVRTSTQEAPGPGTCEDRQHPGSGELIPRGRTLLKVRRTWPLEQSSDARPRWKDSSTR